LVFDPSQANLPNPEMEDEVIILRRILDEVEVVCGQGTMNCVGSKRIKDLLKTRPQKRG
jgi:hypothetical protein